MTPDEMIEVIQAHKDGKEIQWRRKNEQTWHDCCDPLWDFDCHIYRVKPGPREFWINVYRENVKQVYDTEQIAKHYADLNSYIETIHVREVTDE